jgi:hypothetical protein
MTEISVHDFHREVDCIYDDERYSVRDNGAVLRHPRTAKRPRPTDNQWTFGKPNSQNGYMYISQVRIHRIVATAFHGEPPTPEHVVDHIDTNRRNNRPENLRWLTRLENALLNPITVKRIEFICGSIEAFLEDPSTLRHGRLERNFEWMRTVSREEAQACRKRMHLWAKSDKPPSGNGSLGEWVFKPIVFPNPPLRVSREVPRLTRAVSPPREWVPSPSSYPEEHDLVMAKTLGAAQRKWRIPTEFPCCPQEVEEEPLAAYAEKLTTGTIFSRNDFSTHVILETAVIDNGQSICVMCESNGMKPWSLAKITFEDGLYVHTSISTFFRKEGAEKQFYFARGLEWTGGDSIDDYC